MALTAERGDVLLVGSLPFDTVEEAFRGAAEGLGRHALGYPDGEVGDRSSWVGFLIGAVFVHHPQLRATSPALRSAGRQPRTDEEREQFRRSDAATFVVEPGEKIRFDDLHYGRIAVESYRVLRKLRDEGAVPPEVRFQVGLPAPNSVVMPFFRDPEQWPELRGAYLEGMRREIATMLASIPAEDLLIQWEACFEIMDLALGEEGYFPFWPRASVEEKLGRHAAPLGELAALVPAEALLGFHWCYGTWGGWPMTAMQDLELCVRMSNEAVRRSPRRVDYVHMPVLRQPEASFFAPLADLDVGDTSVFLGMVHHTDGVEGFRKRATLARRHLADFGIASVCGYGRVDPAELPHILAVHRACAAERERR